MQGGSVDLRGADRPDGVQGGQSPSGPASDVQLESTASLTTSSTGPLVVTGPGAWSVVPGTRPVLDLEGVAQPGETLSFEVYEDAGTIGILILTLQEATASLPTVTTTPLWLDLGGIVNSFLVVGLGPTVPTAVATPIPASPALAGLELHAQAALYRPELGVYEGTNSVVVAISE